MTRKQNLRHWEPEKSLYSTLQPIKEVIIQFRIVVKDLIPLVGLTDSETLKLIELLPANIASVEPAKPKVPSTASEVPALLSMETILSNYCNVSDDTIGKLEGELHLYTK